MRNPFARRKVQVDWPECLYGVGCPGPGCGEWAYIGTSPYKRALQLRPGNLRVACRNCGETLSIERVGGDA